VSLFHITLFFALFSNSNNRGHLDSENNSVNGRYQSINSIEFSSNEIPMTTVYQRLPAAEQENVKGSINSKVINLFVACINIALI
jgi:hypothetical protein